MLWKIEHMLSQIASRQDAAQPASVAGFTMPGLELHQLT